MFSSYAQKSSSVPKIATSKAASVFDSSVQSKFLQRKADMANNAVRCEELPNNTGMPDNLKSNIESLSGFSMDDVRVHYNSSKPATVQALAYTQGTDIHVAPGQEKCLPHEAWHVAQQMAGRVSPTTNINGMPVNDNAALEHEADVMGEKAVQCKSKTAYAKKNVPLDGKNVQRLKYEGEKKKVVKIFCRIWNGIYDDILKNKDSSKNEILIAKIEPISVILTDEHSTSFDSTVMTVWVKKDDVNGNPDQLLQRCLHELGHYVDSVERVGFYASVYCNELNNRKAKTPNEVYSHPCIGSVGRELYADMFAFVVRMQKVDPKNDNDLEQMIESIDLSGRPQTWIEVQLFKGYPPAKYEKELILKYGKMLLQENSKYDYVKLFDENFNSILIQLTNDMQEHHSELSKGMALIYLSNWYKGKENAKRVQLSIECYKFTENDVPQNYEHIWESWRRQKDFAVKSLDDWNNGNIDAKSLQNYIELSGLAENDIPQNYKHIWEKWKLQKKFAVQTLIGWYKGKLDEKIVHKSIEKIALTENDIPNEHKHIWKLQKELVVQTLVDWHNKKIKAKEVQNLIEKIPLTDNDIPKDYKHIWKEWRENKESAIQSIVAWYKCIKGADEVQNAIDEIALTEGDIPEDFQRYWDTWNFEK